MKYFNKFQLIQFDYIKLEFDTCNIQFKSLYATKQIFGFMLVIMTLTFLLGSCSATTYKVGDSDGWTTKDDIRITLGLRIKNSTLETL